MFEYSSIVMKLKYTLNNGFTYVDAEEIVLSCVLFDYLLTFQFLITCSKFMGYLKHKGRKYVSDCI